MKIKDSGIHIRIESDLLAQFREYAEKVGISQSDLLRGFIVILVDGQLSKRIKIDLDPRG